MHLLVDTVDSCNLRCPTCVRGAGMMPHSNDIMDIGLYEKIVKKAKKEGYELINLYNWSGSFLLAVI